MIKQNSSKGNNLDLIDCAHRAYINEQATHIKTYIFHSKFANNYMKYSYNYKNEEEVSSSLTNDDWHFCILICKFIKSKESFFNIVLILEYFLYHHRYHEKFDNDSSYLKLTINKVITWSIKCAFIGVLRPHKDIHDVVHGMHSRFVKSIDRKGVLKVCNILSPFFLDKANSINLNYSSIYENSLNADNNIKVGMLGGILNSFDLCVFLSVLKEFYTTYDYQEMVTRDIFKDHSFEVDIKMSSLIALFQSRNSGTISNRILNSLNKISKTHIEVYKHYNKSDSEEKIYYSYSGNLLSFESIRIKRFVTLRIYLSYPLIKVFEANQYYALINWESFTLLPNYNLRLLYFYF